MGILYFTFTKSGKVDIDKLAVGVPYEYYDGNIRGNNTKRNKTQL